MSVSLYDVLGVESDASADEIKAAWREATDKFEPGQRSAQFRLFNEAADVLLDPERRVAYDAELAAEGPAVSSEAGASSTATSAAATKAAAKKATTKKTPVKKTPAKKAAAEKTSAKKSAAKAPATKAVATKAVATKAPATKVSRASAASTKEAVEASTTPARATSSVPPWVIAVLAVLTVAALAVAATFYFQHRHDGQVQDAGDDASAAAERALPAVLSYDYRHLKADRDQAVKFLAPRYRTEYTKTFDRLIESSGSTPGPAVQAKAVVKATVEDVGVVSAEAGRARVIVFLNQATTKGSDKPTLSLNRLTVSMVKSGNQWLIADIASY